MAQNNYLGHSLDKDIITSEENDDVAQYQSMTHYVKIKQDAVLEAVSEHTLESENHSDSLGREDFESNRRKLFELLELHHADQIMPKQIHVKLLELLNRGGYNIESYLQLYYSHPN